MQTIVLNTRKEKVSVQFKTIERPIVDGELILIPDRNGEYISCLQADLPVKIGYRGFCKPIIISRTETLISGDMYIVLKDMEIHKYEGGEPFADWSKIIVFPEQFSKEQLSGITEKYYHDRDKLFVDCERDKEICKACHGMKSSCNDCDGNGIFYYDDMVVTLDKNSHATIYHNTTNKRTYTEENMIAYGKYREEFNDTEVAPYTPKEWISRQ